MSRLSVIAAILFATGCMLCPPAFADCSQGGDCAYVTVGATATVQPTTFAGAYPACQQVTNRNCQLPVMVPIGNQSEWGSFVANHEACVTLGGCDAYTWIGAGWSACSAACGGGTQTQTYSCQQTDPMTGIVSTVASGLCTTSIGASPAASQACNPQACVAYGWTDWGACSATCGGGTQTRSCVGTDGSTDPSGAACGGPVSQACNPQACEVDCPYTQLFNPCEAGVGGNTASTSYNCVIGPAPSGTAVDSGECAGFMDSTGNWNSTIYYVHSTCQASGSWGIAYNGPYSNPGPCPF